MRGRKRSVREVKYFEEEKASIDFFPKDILDRGLIWRIN